MAGTRPRVCQLLALKAECSEVQTCHRETKESWDAAGPPSMMDALEAQGSDISKESLPPPAAAAATSR